MARKYTKDEIRELAASYALGNLSDAEKKEFEELLRNRDGSIEKELKTFEEVVEHLLYDAGSMEGPKGLEERLFSQIRKEKRKNSTDEGFLYVRQNEGEWVEIMKGVMIKNLYRNPEKNYATLLVRMEPGATFPNHVHTDTEECYIIEGDLRMGGQVFGKGDYIRAEAHSTHERISTEKGCFLLIAASEENELLA
ncbi:MAG: cupin domain-containing protein [Thermodesulfobacteriota bacterium]